MERNRVDIYMISNSKYFEADKMMIIQEKLLSMPDDRYLILTSLDLKDPTTMLLVSIFLGQFGIDRFMLGDIGMGVLKLLTAGCCGILTIIDWFTITKKTKEQNFNKFMNLMM